MSQHLRQRLAAALLEYAPRGAAIEPHLQAALHQVVANPGKLIRAQFVTTAVRHHGLPAAASLKLACAIEYFHTASLILDDLPCMDDASLRRGMPCIHRQHGEATAILASLALINRAYALVGETFVRSPARVRLEVNACLDRCLGVLGLVGGQAWDLAFARTERTPRDISRIAAQKTGALFELTILLPALLARPIQAERRALHSLCVYWGQIFQVADDLRDVISSSHAEGKDTHRDATLQRPNLVHSLGLPHTRARLARLHRQVARALSTLNAAPHPLRWTYLQNMADALATATALADRADTAAA